MYAPNGMARLRAGEPPDAVAAALLSADAGRDHRQLHIIDAQGRIAQHTGQDCVVWCGAVRGADVSVAGNMLAGPAVVERTLTAFQRAAGRLAERLLTALEAGEAAGGDKRGKQSAALKICTRDPYPDLDIRTDDHPIRWRNCAGSMPSARSGSPCSDASSPAPTARAACSTAR